jgi:transcriptional repressor NrdR
VGGGVSALTDRAARVSEGGWTMQCPFCGQDKDKVVDSRSSEGGRVVRRRRQCLLCRRRFTTYERPEQAVRLWIVKKSGRGREPYDRDKIIKGLEYACHKRPVSSDEIRRIVESAEEEIFRHFDREVPSQFIGDVLSRHLQSVDKIAYVRFASVYREFRDVGDLIDEAQVVRDAPTVGPEQGRLFDEADETAEPDRTSSG